MKDEIKSSKKKNHKSNSKKVVINTKDDLNKLSFSDLKNTKIFDFSGKFFDFIYDRALGIEKNPNEKEAFLSSKNYITNKNATNKKVVSLKENEKISKVLRSSKKTTKKQTNNIILNIQKKKDEKKNIINNNINANINNNINNNLYFNQENYNIYNNITSSDITDSSMDYTNQSMQSTLSNKYNNNIGIVRQLKIDKIVFQMKYNTLPGEDLGVIGSIEELGMWDQNKALKLTWNSGNVWKSKINFNFSRTNSFEFKFIFISNGRVKQWEDGNNRKINYEQLKEIVEPNIKEGYLVEFKNIGGNNIIYNYKDTCLTIVCDWNKK